MTTYKEYFTEQMAVWLKERNGPPPVFNPPMKDPDIVYKKFDLAKAITELAINNPALAVWIYEHWALKQDIRYKHRQEKSQLLDQR
jgi:hypothetical protein